MNIDVRSSLTHVAQGLLMGGADIIPGVSGGTMALVVGIYERLVRAISHLFSVLLAAGRMELSAARREFGQVDWALLLPLGAGIVCALVVGARILPGLLERYPHQCRGLFFGLIAASVVIPWQRIRRPRAATVGVVLGAAALAFVLVGLPPRTIPHPHLLQVFGAAAVAICAMILPGVSGAFLLLVLGIYEPTLQAIDGRDVLYVGTFAAGAAVGLGLFSKVLSWLLAHYHDRTMAVLVGLMVGSLRALWPWLGADRQVLTPAPGEPVLSVVALALAGFAFVILLLRWSPVSVEAEG